MMLSMSLSEEVVLEDDVAVDFAALRCVDKEDEGEKAVSFSLKLDSTLIVFSSVVVFEFKAFFSVLDFHFQFV